MSETGVRVATTDAEREDAFAVRRTVFVEEQGVDEELEWDEDDEPDAETIHFVAYDDGEAVGAARLRTVAPGVGKVERVAVTPGRRGEDWGTRLMESVEKAARERGVSTLKLHAQIRTRPFYETLGYEAIGDEFTEAGIPHVEMRKSCKRADRCDEAP